jgi:FkbM family methyltransferase
MKLLRSCPNIINAISPELDSSFTLVDVGCAFGIDQPFQDFREKLIAYGFEASIEECQRLIDNNQNPRIHYVPAFVKLDPSHPFAIAKTGKPHWSNNPWSHLAVARSLESLRPAQMSGIEKAASNLWSATKLADQIHDVYLDKFLPEQGINSIDLCKIDVDGADFDILHSLEGIFSEKKVLAVVIEVNYFGSDNDTDHTFHNVDRYMRRYGFDLYGLTVNKYSAKSLPARYYFSSPGENLKGRPYQGDALYVLDVFSDPAATRLNRDHLLKLVAIFALFDLPDWAAELLQLHGPKHVEVGRINQIFEMLTRQIQEGRTIKLDYTNYISAFDKRDAYFYSTVSEGGKKCCDESIMEELAQLRAEVMSLKNSASWRFTAPLRFLARCIRRNGSCA